MKVDQLLGREYRSNDADCYELMRDFYRDNFEIELRDYARPKHWWVRNPELDFIRKNLAAEGFIITVSRTRADLKPGDGICMAIGSTVGNHLGVYLGGNKFLHHPFRARSTIDLYAGDWANKTVFTARHPRVYVLDPRPLLDLSELIPPHKRAAYESILKAHGLPGWYDRTGGSGST